MEGYTSGKSIAYILHEDGADGAYYHQEWQRMPQMTPLISGGTNVCFLLTLDIEQLISDSRKTLAIGKTRVWETQDVSKS